MWKYIVPGGALLVIGGVTVIGRMIEEKGIGGVLPGIIIFVVAVIIFLIFGKWVFFK